jgi:hypothetical protein
VNAVLIHSNRQGLRIPNGKCYGPLLGNKEVTHVHRNMQRLLALVLTVFALAGCGQKASTSATPANASGSASQAGSGAPTDTSTPNPAGNAQPREADAPATTVSNTNPTAGATAPVQKEPALPGTLLVMVENHFYSRPQSGLQYADWVFEMNAEAGITRYMAAFYSNRVEKIGPVRSARMYFYEIARAFKAPYAHAGASDDAFAAITLARKNEGFPDLDDIYSAGGCFWRAKDRKMPHNLYTSTDMLLACARERKQPMTPLPTLPTGDLYGGQPATDIKLSFSGDSPDIAWKWENGRYKRYQNGAPHVMDDGTALAFDNLVVLWAPHKWHKPADTWKWKIDIVGSGKARFFRDGKTFSGTWTKTSPDSHFVFKLDDGKPMTFAPGTIFFEVLKDADPFSFGA